MDSSKSSEPLEALFENVNGEPSSQTQKTSKSSKSNVRQPKLPPKSQSDTNYLTNYRKNLRKIEISETQAAEYVRSVIAQMNRAADEDELAVSEKRLGLSKLKILNKVLSEILKPKWTQWFLCEGVCAALGRWLATNENGALPSLAFRTEILQTLQKLPIHIEHMKGTDLGIRLVNLWKSPYENDENREAIRTVVQNILRPVLGQKDDIEDAFEDSLEEPQKNEKFVSKSSSLLSNVEKPKWKRNSKSTSRKFLCIDYNSSSHSQSSNSGAYTFKVMPKSDVYALQNNEARSSNQRFNQIISNKRGRFRT